ncbi:flagellar assembly protein FliW [Cohnella silvisoli]|uniref:Flagellar assembly factor FliW n=1 Tax=Cohnella silvisoli TaxID=2873699 RepID=A0ABV1KPM8_9BACL|nr:flagellar assembly protein FliW [Cohnella silvisoli]MCD9022307.1 flagellar assembly protein FliW [Cohnella silvisoli]
MIVNSVVLGDIEVDDNQVIRFENGMPGFEQLKAFVLVQLEPELPFSYLQSVEEAEVAFLLTDPFTFYPGYDIQLSEQVIEDLRIGDEKDVQVWSVVTMKEDIHSATMNLLAPVIINTKEVNGRQVILQNTKYVTKHPLVAGQSELQSSQTAASKESSGVTTTDGDGE